MATDATRRALIGWGGTSPTVARVVRPRTTEEIATALDAGDPRGMIARGLGRAYGDAAQNAGGLVLDCTAMHSIGPFDEATGRVTVSGGAPLDAVIDAVLPTGWFLPVTPGTRHVTVGGAVAADVHGKNHHTDGSLARHLIALTLLSPDGDLHHLTPDDDPDLFWATIGGMGLTGVIVDATVQLTPVETRFMSVETHRARDLDEVMALLYAGDVTHRYSAAWLDLAARGAGTGRGVVALGNHTPLHALSVHDREPSGISLRRRTPALPIPAPSWFVSRSATRTFNEWWFRRTSIERVEEVQTLEAFCYPLDAVGHWNRLYGAAGFIQWQCALPMGEEARLREVVSEIAQAPVPVTLAVLKRFGAGSAGHLSFPIPGWTLAVDLPAARGSGLDALLDRLDERVADSGGRVYLAKDSRMRPEWLPLMYPRLADWREVQARVDPGGRFTSDLDRRLGLTATAARRLRPRTQEVAQ